MHLSLSNASLQVAKCLNVYISGLNCLVTAFIVRYCFYSKICMLYSLVTGFAAHVVTAIIRNYSD